ncbi:MAG: hypothetical protein ACJ763_12050 [Bdellovibrionia bacterium]
MSKTSHKAVFIFLIVMTLSGVANARPNPVAELEKLDSAANLLLFTSDAARPGQCKIKPEEAKKLLMVIHPMIDEEKKKAAGMASNPKWEKTCSKSCHCGLYASILDAKGDQSLNDQERVMMQHLYKKAQQMTSHEAKACATRDAAWFCKSDLLKKLRKEAEEYPNPAQRKQPVTPHG